MTELEKDIGNLRSGLKSVESVSHKDLWDNSCCVMPVRLYNVQVYLPFFLWFPSPGSFCFYPTGARTPEEAAAGAGRQVRVGGESVHHCGQLQLLRRGGLAHRGQGTGKSRRRCVSAADACVESLHPISSWCSCSYMPFWPLQSPLLESSQQEWSGLASCRCITQAFIGQAAHCVQVRAENRAWVGYRLPLLCPALRGYPSTPQSFKLCACERLLVLGSSFNLVHAFSPTVCVCVLLNPSAQLVTWQPLVSVIHLQCPKVKYLCLQRSSVLMTGLQSNTVTL